VTPRQDELCVSQLPALKLLISLGWEYITPAEPSGGATPSRSATPPEKLHGRSILDLPPAETWCMLDVPSQSGQTSTNRRRPCAVHLRSSDTRTRALS